MNDVELIRASIEQLERVSRSIASIGENEDYTEVAINVLEKQIPKKPIHKIEKYGKHKWKKGDDGQIDDFAWEFDIHRGVVCERCGKEVCVYCNPDYDKLEDCEEESYICATCNDKVYYKHKFCNCGQKFDYGE